MRKFGHFNPQSALSAAWLRFQGKKDIPEGRHVLKPETFPLPRGSCRLRGSLSKPLIDRQIEAMPLKLPGPDEGMMLLVKAVGATL
jgi:hypothetical protein